MKLKIRCNVCKSDVQIVHAEGNALDEIVLTTETCKPCENTKAADLAHKYAVNKLKLEEEEKSRLMETLEFAKCNAKGDSFMTERLEEVLTYFENL